MAVVPLNGIRLHYEDAGSGAPPLVFSTGYAGTVAMWSQQVADLRNSYRCVTYDLRGHGQTEAPRDLAQYDESLMLGDIDALLGHLSIQRAVLVGLSLGGYLSFKYALANPERVAGLVLMATGPGFRDEVTGRPWRQECEARARLLREEGMRGFMESEFSAADYYTPPEVMRNLDPLGLANVAEGVMARTLGADRVQELKMPVLLIVGDQDAPYLRGCEYMHRQLPNSQLVVIPGAGHAVNIDEPAKATHLMRTFLSEVHS